ncbi:dynactin subunit p22 domain-containing protein [Sarocladium implicatum]|nr:dynactin subunit p22 domain-containing protein [Sarocladium implicatum]
MDESIDQTTLSTLSLLESRLNRIEHVLHGQAISQSSLQGDSASRRLADLERHFTLVTSRIRVYGELLKIYKKQPDLFDESPSSEPPSQLDFDALRAIVMASASSFPATLSALTAIKDTPIPDPGESANLVALTERMRAIEATQMSQAAEVAELRGRSEVVMRTWYERGVLANSQALADIESRVERAERTVRRSEKRLELENEI